MPKRCRRLQPTEPRAAEAKRKNVGTDRNWKPVSPSGPLEVQLGEAPSEPKTLRVYTTDSPEDEIRHPQTL